MFDFNYIIITVKLEPGVVYCTTCVAEFRLSPSRTYMEVISVGIYVHHRLV